jgi:tetratricopeptide (TPR) repeat protein
LQQSRKHGAAKPEVCKRFSEMIEQSEQIVVETLQRLRKVTAGLAANEKLGGQPDRQSPSLVLRRAIEELHHPASPDGENGEANRAASAGAASKPSSMRMRLDAVLQALEEDAKESPMPVQTRALVALAGLYQALGENAAALALLRRWLERTDSRRDLLTRGQVQLQLGGILADLGDWISATQAIEGSQAVLSTARDHAGMVSAQIVLGKIAYKQGNYPVARENFEKALLLAEEYNDARRVGIIKMELGVIARMQARSNHALACFQDALIQFQSAQDSAGAAECLNHLSVLHLQKQRLREAESCVDKAIAFCRENGWPHVLAYCYLNKAAVSLEAGDHALAAKTWGRGAQLMARLQNPPGLAKAIRLCAQILAAIKEAATAEEVLKISAQLYQRYCIPLGLANCYLDLAALLRQKDEKAANDYAAWAHAILESLKLPADTMISHKRSRQSRRTPLTKSITLEET